ncbi:MAG: ATP-binding protein [Bacteroidota bacterium]
MKNQSPSNIALLSSLVVGFVISLIFSALVYFFTNQMQWWLPLVFFALSFLICFGIFSYILREFIYDKIRLIYKNIHELKSTKDFTSKNVDISKDIFKEVDKEVVRWAEDKKNEIEELKKLEIYRREYIGNVSHELKTPIFNIQGYILTLLEGGLEDPNINRDYLQRSSRSVDRMISIIEDLETISQLEANELQLYMDKFDIVQLAKDVFRGLEMRAETRNIKLVFNQNYDKPIKVYADKDRIRQVFTNLIVNSIKYGKEDGLTEVRFYDMDQNILVEVSDNGPGISKQHLPRLFERFYRVDKGRSRDQGGTGLGLAIVKHIIEAHQQTINVRSTEGVGSTFSFTLKKA